MSVNQAEQIHHKRARRTDAQTQSRQTCEESQLVGYFLENKTLKVCWKIIMGKQYKTPPLEL